MHMHMHMYMYMLTPTRALVQSRSKDKVVCGAVSNPKDCSKLCIPWQI